MTLDLPLFRNRRGRGGGGAGSARCGTGGRAGDALRCRGPGFLLPAHLGGGRRQGWELSAPQLKGGRAGSGRGKAAPVAAAGGGRAAAAGAWSAALHPRRSRKRWKRGWTITATSPAPTLLEKLRGKTGAAADRGSSFLYRKTSFLAISLLCLQRK